MGHGGLPSSWEKLTIKTGNELDITHVEHYLKERKKKGGRSANE